MSDVNSVTISGRLTDAPKSYSGDAVARFSLASNRSYRKQGEDSYVEEVCFVEVSCFSGLAVKVLRKLDRGSYCVVQGRLELNRWEAEDGTNRQQLRVIATEIASEAFFMKTEDSEPAEAAPQPVAARRTARSKTKAS